MQNGNGTPKVGESRRAGQLAQEAFRIEAPLLTADRPIRTQAAADTLAQAMADRRASRFIEAEWVCSGNSKLVAGTSVKLDNIGTRFNGTYYVTSARHVYTGEAGYTTHFSITGQNPATLLALLAPEPAAASARDVGSSREEVQSLLKALQDGLRADGDPTRLGDAAWERLRALLEGLSASRAAKGLAAADTSPVSIRLPARCPRRYAASSRSTRIAQTMSSRSATSLAIMPVALGASYVASPSTST